MKKALLITAVLSLSGSLLAQAWRSSLYPTNWTPPAEANNFYTGAFIQDFSYAGYQLGEKDIPFINSNIVDVTKAPYSADNTGGTDVTAKIQSAINKVQTDGGGVVFLPAGNYKLSAGANDFCLRINKSNVVLRGAGVGKTYLYNSDNNMNRKDIITVEGSGGNWKSEPSTVANITRDLNGPTSVIPVDNTSLFKVGDKVVLRQKLTAAWANEHKEPEWATSSYASSLGGIINFRIIKSIDAIAKTITIDAPIKYAFKTRDEACVYKSPATMIEEVGLEDFSIGNKEVVTNFTEWCDAGSTTDLKDDAEKTTSSGAYDCNGSYVVGFSKVLNSWMKNVSTYTPSVNQFKTQMLSNGVKLDQSRGVTIDNVDVGYAQYGGGAGNAYGFRIESNDCLIMNSKAEYVRHGFVFSFMHSSGNVLYNNTCRKSGKCTANAPNGLNTGSSGSDFHMWFSPSNLIDNMTFDESYFSAVHRKGVASDHGAVTAHSVFWNTTGTNARASVVIRTSQTRFGYVMGTKGNTPAVDYKVSDKMGLAFRYDTDGSRTSPEDKVEGIGKGADLMPQSLYLDQLAKRLNNIVEAKAPYTGTPISIPGTIEAENYDKGGEGVSYHDMDPENKGAALSNFRINDGVDIGTGNGGNVLAYTATDEWVEYTVKVTKAASYDFEFHAASLNGGGLIGVDVDGNSLFTGLNVSKTSDWAVYQPFTQTSNLTVGNHVLRINIEKNGFNLDKIVVKTSTVTSIEEASNSAGIQVYPNPSKNGLFQLSNSSNWQVYTPSGQLIQSGLSDEINLGTEVKGLFILEVEGKVEKLLVD